MKLVHAADLHIDSPLTGLARYEGAPVGQIRAATRRAMENLVSYCVQQRVDLLLLAGDLFDGDWKDYSTGLFFVRQMLNLKQAGIAVVLVRGNHDAASVVTKHLRLPDNVVELSSSAPETRIYEDLGVAVHGQSYARRAEKDNLAAQYPDAVPGYVNIGLLHTCATGRPGHGNYAPCSLKTLLSKEYDYWALGHVHAREVLHEQPWVVFPGNLQSRHIQETGAKGATLISVEDGAIQQVSHVPLDVVRFEVVDYRCEPEDDADAAVEGAAMAFAQRATMAAPRLLVARIRLVGPSGAHRAFQSDPTRWEAELRARAAELDNVWLHSVIFRTRPTVDPEAATRRDDAVGQVARRLEQLLTPGANVAALESLFVDLEAKLPASERWGSGSSTTEPSEPAQPGEAAANIGAASHRWSEELLDVRAMLLSLLESDQASHG